LFKRWFIDFEFPFDFAQGKPNANGGTLSGVEGYKSSGGEMVESELGEIPKGWSIDSLDNIADFLNGLALQKFPPENEFDFLPVIKIKELRQKNTSNSDKASNKIPEKYIIQNGDVLFSWSGSLMVDFWTNGNGALNQHLFKVTSNQFPKWYYYLWTKFHLIEFIKIAESKATTMGHIQRQHLSDAKVLIPNVINEFALTFDPLITKLIDNRIENVELTNLRDTLLPKLISGALEIKGQN
jgi:type I restriction enzyme S subunit